MNTAGGLRLSLPPGREGPEPGYCRAQPLHAGIVDAPRCRGLPGSRAAAEAPRHRLGVVAREQRRVLPHGWGGEHGDHVDELAELALHPVHERRRLERGRPSSATRSSRPTSALRAPSARRRGGIARARLAPAVTGARLVGAVSRCSEQLPVDLAAAGERQLLVGDEASRDHVLREGGLEEGAQRRSSTAADARRHGRRGRDRSSVTDDADGGFEDAGVLAEGGFDLAELDALAAELDLVVEPAEVLERAVGQPAGQVAGPVQPRARAGRTGRARTAPRSGPAGRGSRGRRCTPPMYSSPATPTGTGCSASSSTWIVVLAIGRADRHQPAVVVGRHCQAGHVDRGLGRAVEVVQLGVGQHARRTGRAGRAAAPRRCRTPGAATCSDAGGRSRGTAAASTARSAAW